jgi:hypothetical protein
MAGTSALLWRLVPKGYAAMKNILFSSIIAALLLSSCSLLPNFDFNAAQSRWQSAHLTHYRYDLHVGCFCAFVDRMPLSIEVENGTVKSMLYNDGTPVPQDQQEIFARYAPIDTMFAFTADALHRADETKVEYDAKYGFPATLYIDYIRQAADDELSLSASNFQPLP